MDATEDYKREFIEFLAISGAIEGERRLKSGRLSPYFINTGNFMDGESLTRLGEAYAGAIADRFDAAQYQVIFGPAYKGITLCSEAAAALYRVHGLNKLFSFNRKEQKLHGDVGQLVGHRIQGDDGVVIVDDVFTTGDTKREALDLIRTLAPGARVVGLLIAVDRMEQDAQGEDAIARFVAETGVAVHSIVTIHEALAHLTNRPVRGRVYLDCAWRAKIDAYLRQYGVKSR